MRVRLKRERLLAILAGSPLSQNHWALKLGFSRGHWSEIVNGKHPYPSARTRSRMLEVFGVGLEELFAIESDPEPLADADFRSALGDRYLIDSELGQGGFGVVYLARDIRLRRPVVLKVISPEAVAGVGLAPFFREIGVVTLLQHPNILPLHDSGEAGGRPWFVMPWIRGGSLRDRLAAGPIPVDEALAIAEGIARGLEYAHGRRVIHGDLKPENVLLDGDHPYLIDFGIAQAVHREILEWGPRAEPDPIRGASGYPSPEQRGGAAIDPRADVYGLGCLLVEMLTGRPLPAEGGSGGGLAELATRAPELSPAVRAALARGLAEDPADRIESPRELVAEVRGAWSAPDGRLPRSRPRWPPSAGRRRPSRRPFRTSGGFVGRTLDDIRQAVRTLRQRPGFAGAVLGIQALAIAANATVFGLANAVIFQPLPYRAESELHALWSSDDDGRFGVSQRERAAYRAEPGLFAGVATWVDDAVAVQGEGDPEQVPASAVDRELLPVLGVIPALGRNFTEDEDTEGNAGAVILADHYWRRRLGGDPGVIGRTLIVEGQPRTIVGVLPPGARLPTGFLGAGAGILLPLASPATPDPRNFHYLNAVVRLRPDRDLAATQAALSVLAARLKAEITTLPPDFDARLVPLREEILGDSRPIALLLLGAVGLMLLVAAANVAGLVLARAEGRRREIAVRAALGAGRPDLIRQLLTESLVIGVAGGLVGLGIAAVAVRGLATFALPRLPRADTIGLDWITVAYTAAIAIGAALLAGLAPAWQLATRPDLNDALGDGSRSASGGRQRTRLRRGLVVAEMALAVTLAVGAGLMIRTWRSVLASDLGFAGERALTLRVSLGGPEFAESGARWRFYRDLTDAVAALPGVERVGATRALPLVSRVGDWGFSIEGRPPAGPNERNPFGDWHVVTDGYFEALGIPLLEGRTFERGEDTTRSGVVIVNRALARRYWPDRSPIGARIKMSSNVDTLWRTVIGVVGDVRQLGLELEPRPEYFLPHAQYPRTTGRPPAEMYLVVKARGGPAEIAGSVRGVVRQLAPGAPVSDVRSMEAVVSDARAGRRFQLFLLAGFAIAAVSLLAVGVYGVVAQVVGLRTREFGIRMSLGASASGVERMVLTEQLGPLGLGLLLGVAGGLGLGGAMRGLLYGVGPADPVVLAGAAVVVAVAVLVGSVLPARRAAATELTEVLRAE